MSTTSTLNKVEQDKRTMIQVNRFNHAIEIAELEPRTALTDAMISGMKAQRDDLLKQIGVRKI